MHGCYFIRLLARRGEGLFKSVPRLGGHKERLDTIPGNVPNPARFPSGCKFHTRCPRTRALGCELCGQWIAGTAACNCWNYPLAVARAYLGESSK